MMGTTMGARVIVMASSSAPTVDAGAPAEVTPISIGRPVIIAPDAVAAPTVPTVCADSRRSPTSNR